MSRLGRGLDALIKEAPEASDRTTGITTIKCEYIYRNKYQPRKIFEKDKLEDLAQSLKENGMIQPIIVTKTDDKLRYELVAGERRLEAAKIAGFSKVPVIIRSLSDKEKLQFAIIENIQRENLNSIEEATAYQQLHQEFSLTHAQISEIIGKDRATITNSLRLLKLSPEIQEFLLYKKISSGHARALLQVKEEKRIPFANKIMEFKLSVRQAEEMAKKINSGNDENLPLKKTQTVDFSVLESKLKSAYKVKVKISEKDNKGKISFYFKNEEEKHKLLSLLKQKHE